MSSGEWGELFCCNNCPCLFLSLSVFCRLADGKREQELVEQYAPFTDRNAFVTLEEFAERLNVSVDNDSTRILFKIFNKVRLEAAIRVATRSGETDNRMGILCIRK